MAISEVYKFELREDEDLTFFMNFDNSGRVIMDGELKNVKFYTLKEILNSENIFPPTLVTLNKVFEKELTLLFKKEVLG